MGFSESISPETVRQILKKTLKPWQRKESFPKSMEDVLDLYQEDHDPDHPVVCFDETSKQLVKDVRPAIEARPDVWNAMDISRHPQPVHVLRTKGGWRHVEVTDDCCGLRSSDALAG